MLVANSFDLWQKDAFFSAAEEVQESADRMESAYRAWLRERREPLAVDDFDECSRELQTALGTAKWQLEEFDKAVRLSYGYRGDDNTMARHRQFIDAIANQILYVETSLKDSFKEDGKKPFKWLNLDEEERDDLAAFLTGIYPQKAKADSLEHRTGKSPLHEIYNKKEAEIINSAGCSLNSSDKLDIIEDFSRTGKNSHHVIEMKTQEIYRTQESVVSQMEKTSNAKRIWNSPNFGGLKIVIPTDDEVITQFMGTCEVDSKGKGSKSVFWKQRCIDLPNARGSVNVFSQWGSLSETIVQSTILAVWLYCSNNTCFDARYFFHCTLRTLFKLSSIVYEAPQGEEEVDSK